MCMLCFCVWYWEGNSWVSQVKFKKSSGRAVVDERRQGSSNKHLDIGSYGSTWLRNVISPPRVRP
jgi:hypothetical protein